MGRVGLTALVSLAAAMVFAVGCEESYVAAPPAVLDANSLSVYSGYVPVRIDVLPLTEVDSSSLQATASIHPSIRPTTWP